MKDFFTANRARLTDMLGGGLVVVAAYTAMQRSNDIAFTFEQEANFWWLTGVEAADWWLILDGIQGKSWLVAPSIDEPHTLFDGGLTPESALKVSGAHAVLKADEAKRLLRELAKKHSIVYTLGEHPQVQYFHFSLNPAPKRLHDMLERTFNTVQDCRKELAQLRAIKQPYEITHMKKAINATADLFEDIKNRLPEFRYEYEIEAEFAYQSRRKGMAGCAYVPVVAVGKNACTIHYINNNARLKEHRLLLLDVCLRSHGYTSDIARTYALGQPTERQKAVHAAVQSAQRHIISLLKPNLLIEQYQREVDSIMIEALMQLGLMKSRDDEKKYRHYFPHAISHGLGIDAHDSLGAPRFLQSGMVLTVEPGIYIPEEGIGVRIEDDILITNTGHINLSTRLSTDL